MKFKETIVLLLVFKFTKPLVVPKACTRYKLREVERYHLFFELIITLLLFPRGMIQSVLDARQQIKDAGDSSM